MGEPESGEGQVGQSGASAVPESVKHLHEPGHAADPTFGDELPVFPPSSKSAGTLDLAVAADEPEQLVRYLIMAAQEHIGFSENESKWKILLGHFAQAAKELEKLNEPSRRGATASSS